ncbi:hypothetical protein [Streptomyces sp. NPDC012888]|uniref:hypothetical protein n=1 Tax=Streptomyces sp. NPDC012888 TaxID=3364855 RepID=UPI003690A187
MARRGHADGGRADVWDEAEVPGADLALAAENGLTAASGWLLRGRDGRLTAYAGCPEGLVRWTEPVPGADVWDGPVLFPVDGGWTGRFTLTQDFHGFVTFAGTRLREDGRREYVVASQYQTGRPLSSWRAIGYPFRMPTEPAPPEDPVVFCDGAGILHVVAARFGAGARQRTRRADGNWTAWTSYQGNWSRGSVVPMVASDGRAEMLVPFKGGAVHWGQPEPGGALRWRGKLEGEAVEGTYSGCETGPGSITYYWRHPADGSVVAHRPLPASAGRANPLLPLGGAGGVGPAAVTRTRINGYDCTVLLQRGADGCPEVAAYPTEGEQYGAWWAPVGERCAGLPAMTLDHLGAVTIAMLDTEGGLLIARQDLADPGLSFHPWRRAG